MQWNAISIRKRLLMVMMLSGFIELVILAFAGFGYVKYSNEQETGHKALGIAQFISQSPRVKQFLDTKVDNGLSQEISLMTELVGAAFIVIGDKQGIRLIHPISERIGLPMKGGDNIRALQRGEAYISFAKGSLGESVRGKTAVFDDNGEIIGVISVGYLLDNLERQIEPYLIYLLTIALLVLLLNGLFSNYAYRKFQKSLLGFEPEEISRLYSELDTTLSTIKEGVLSIDNQYRLRTLNRSAADILKIDRDSALNRPLQEILPSSDLDTLIENHHNQDDIELYINGIHLLANRRPIIVDGTVLGAVSSFRPKNELTELTQQLARTKEYADLLRSQTHEHRNKLNVISGLLQMHNVEEALSIIFNETDHYQDLISRLRDSIEDPLVAGLILGKIERARELGLELKLEEGSHLSPLPAHIQCEDAITLLGNIIDNAFDATLALPAPTQDNRHIVILSLSDFGHDIVLEVQDQGIGLPRQFEPEQLLKRGISTKSNEDRGIGLHLVNKIIRRYKGSIEISVAKPHGTLISIFLPKEL